MVNIANKFNEEFIVSPIDLMYLIFLMGIMMTSHSKREHMI